MSMLPSCADNEGESAPDNDVELTVSDISDNQWTYISLENNTVVGQSDKNNPSADADWASRTDWDIAICGDMIRTNSGTSGNGAGGLRRLDGHSYDNVTANDAANTDIDRPNTPDSTRE